MPRERILPTDRHFSADIRGVLGGVPFAAHLEIEAEKGSVRAFSLCFLPSDGGLPVGLTLSGLCGVDGLPMQGITVCLGDLRVEVGVDAVQELLFPVTALLSRNSYSTVQKTEAGFLLRFPDDAEMLLSPDFSPLRFSSPSCSFEVT